MDNKPTILSTRLLEEDQVRSLGENGFAFEQFPFIKMKPRTDATLREHINTLAAKPLLGVFTSRVAVAAVIALLDTVPSRWQLACMGGATRAAAENYFGKQAVVLESRSAKELGQKLQVLDSGLPLVFYAGNRRLEELPSQLESHAAGFRELTVYDTTETPVKLEAVYDGILFFSPSAAHSFFSINTIAAHTVLFSIGETTAAVLRSLSPNKVVTSPYHSPAKMVDAVTGYFRT